MIVFEKRTWWKLVFLWQGTALQRVWRRVLLSSGLALVVTIFHERYGLFHTNLTTIPFGLVGVALGVYLGFRNNSGYDRFWEGRKLWGRLVNVSRSFARQVFTVIDEPETTLRRELLYRQIAFVHALRLHLRGAHDYSELSAFLAPAEVAALGAELNRPNAILHETGERLAQLRRTGKIDAMLYPVLAQSLTEMSTVQGACERIKSTPIPASYSVLIHRIVFLYCVTLPFGLVTSVGALSPLVVMFVAYAFYGLDAVGDEIEAPFDRDANDLPLSALSRMIEVNLRQRLGETELPALLQPQNRILD